MATDTPMTVLTVGTSVQTAGWITWSDNILVDASAIPATTILYVTTDGTTPTATNFNYIMNGGEVAIVAYRQPDLYGLGYAGSGGLTSKNGNGYGLTAQSRPSSLFSGISGTTNTSGNPTFISILASAATTAPANIVGVEQR